MHRGLKLSDLLSSLTRRGRVEEAEQLKHRVVAHFGDIINQEDLMQTSVEELIGVLDIFNSIYPQQQPRSDLENHIEGLRQQGYTVIYGEKYLGKHPR